MDAEAVLVGPFEISAVASDAAVAARALQSRRGFAFCSLLDHTGSVVAGMRSSARPPAAIMMAEAVANTGGSLAFSRTGDPDTVAFEDAAVLKTFGQVPSDPCDADLITRGIASPSVFPVLPNFKSSPMPCKRRCISWSVLKSPSCPTNCIAPTHRVDHCAACADWAGESLRQCRAASISASVAPWLRAHVSAADAEYWAT
jgi:hypothetical protein